MIGPVIVLIVALIILICTRTKLSFNMAIWDFKNSEKARELRRQEIMEHKESMRLEIEDDRARAELEEQGLGMDII